MSGYVLFLTSADWGWGAGYMHGGRGRTDLGGFQLLIARPVCFSRVNFPDNLPNIKFIIVKRGSKTM